jgi:hypothetical protein
MNPRRWGLTNPMAQEFPQALNTEIQRDNAQGNLVEEVQGRAKRRFYLMEYLKLAGVCAAVVVGGYLFLLVLGIVTHR